MATLQPARTNPAATPIAVTWPGLNRSLSNASTPANAATKITIGMTKATTDAIATLGPCR